MKKQTNDLMEAFCGVVTSVLIFSMLVMTVTSYIVVLVGIREEEMILFISNVIIIVYVCNVGQQYTNFVSDAIRDFRVSSFFDFLSGRQKNAILIQMQFLNDKIKSRHGFKTAQKFHKF